MANLVTCSVLLTLALRPSMKTLVDLPISRAAKNVTHIYAFVYKVFTISDHFCQKEDSKVSK